MKVGRVEVMSKKRREKMTRVLKKKSGETW